LIEHDPFDALGFVATKKPLLFGRLFFEAGNRPCRLYRDRPVTLLGLLGLLGPFTPLDMPCVVVVVPFGPVTVVPVGPEPVPVGVLFPAGPRLPAVPAGAPAVVPGALPEVAAGAPPAAAPVPLPEVPAPALPAAAPPPAAPPPAPPAPPPPPPPPARLALLISKRTAARAAPNLGLFAATIAYLLFVASASATWAAWLGSAAVLRHLAFTGAETIADAWPHHSGLMTP
jgi:hypothetical protein